MRTSKLIHVEKFGARGIVVGTHAFKGNPYRSKKKARRRPDRAFRVEWLDLGEWTPTVWYPPTQGWISLVDFDNILEIIFHD